MGVVRRYDSYPAQESCRPLHDKWKQEVGWDKTMYTHVRTALQINAYAVKVT